MTLFSQLRLPAAVAVASEEQPAARPRDPGTTYGTVTGRKKGIIFNRQGTKVELGHDEIGDSIAPALLCTLAMVH